MYPYLFSITLGKTHYALPSYGVMLAIAFSAAYLDALIKAKKLRMDLVHVERLYILIVFGAIAGARLFHVLFEEFGYYLEHPLKIFAVWEGGYTFYGAVLFCLGVVYSYCRAKKINFMAFGDLAAGGTAIGLAIGRVGCFLAGCCWGKPTASFLGVTYTNPLSFCPIHDKALHPTQLYEAGAAFLIWIYLTWLVKRRKYEGEILCHGLVLYAIARFVIEIFRGDDIRGYVFNGLFSYSQLVSLFILPFAIAGILTKGQNLWRKKAI